MGIVDGAVTYAGFRVGEFAVAIAVILGEEAQGCEFAAEGVIGAFDFVDDDGLARVPFHSDGGAFFVGSHFVHGVVLVAVFVWLKRYGKRCNESRIIKEQSDLI